MDQSPPTECSTGTMGPTVRRLRFEVTDDLAVAWTPAHPEFACAANSISLLMPYMEPYFVRSVAAAIEPLRGGEQAAGIAAARAYVGQEGEHHRQHQRFNRLLTARYPRLAVVERAAARAYRWLERHRSLAFSLGFVAASETIAYSAARWSAERRRELFTGADPIVATLFLWHLAEEVEHKAVAWDVFRAAGGRRRHYLLGAGAALLLVLVFVGAGTTVMLAAERRLLNPMAWVRLTTWAVTFAFELLSNLAMALLPGHHPDRFTDPLWYEVWLREHDPLTGTLPLWEPDDHQAGRR